MTIERFYCSTASRSNNETLYGTVALARSWLLIEYPSVWRRNAIDDSLLLSKRFKAHVRHLLGRGEVERALLARQDHRLSGPIRCFFVQCCDPEPGIRRLEVSDYDDLIEIQGGEPIDGLMYAVCTHGRHDKCCAKFGLPLYCAVRDQLGDRAWQCSHVGGDRFAGNLVVFPYGVYYGHVSPDDIAEIVRCSERREVWLKRYRGRSCFPRAVQVAEYFARAESGLLRIDEFHPIDVRQIGEDIRQVRFKARSDGSIHAVEFATRLDLLSEMLLTCGSTERAAVPQYKLLRYTVTQA